MEDKLGKCEKLRTNLLQSGKFGTLLSKIAKTCIAVVKILRYTNNCWGSGERAALGMFILNKPAKYGIKINVASDARSKFMLNPIPYLWKHNKNVAESEDVRQHPGNVDVCCCAVKTFGTICQQKIGHKTQGQR